MGGIYGFFMGNILLKKKKKKVYNSIILFYMIAAYYVKKCGMSMHSPPLEPTHR